MNHASCQGVEVLRVPQWGELEWLRHGFSTRLAGFSTVYRREPSGDLNLGLTAADDPGNVAINREKFLSCIASSAERFKLVTLRQIHSEAVFRVGAEDSRNPRDGDGLMTNEPGLLLGIQTADCIPVLVADRRTHAVAAFHAGWRGTVRRIVEKGIARMMEEFGSRRSDLTAAIGPGIGRCCYIVGEELRQEFQQEFAYADQLFDDASSLRLDLVEANRRQLVDAGMQESSIYCLNHCTSCDTRRFFSHRAENGHTGRLMSVIGVER